MTISNYFQPRSLAEAVALLSSHGPDLLVMSGGTVAMPLINEGISLPRQVMGLRQAGLDAIRREGEELHVGATATLTALAGQPHAALLAEAARHTASWAVRNMGTVGGNLFTPPPGGDVATALLALDARVVAASSRGTRDIALGDFFTGFMTTALASDELVAEVVVPLDAGVVRFVKFGRRQANTPAIVTVALNIHLDGRRVTGARIALGAVGPHPFRAHGAEAALVGAELSPTTIATAAQAAAGECQPFDDAVASGWYRRRMAELFVRRALTDVASAQHAEKEA
jgi:CO/xanthine dehydrogenase FAD-binding subunit